MKTIILNLFFIGLAISTFAQQYEKETANNNSEIKQLNKDLKNVQGRWYNNEDVENINGRWYIKEKRNYPYTGPFIELIKVNSTNTIIKIHEGSMVDGLYNGTVISYGYNGTIRRKENYSGGWLHGLIEDYFDNGQIQHKSEYKWNKQVGTSKHWYSTGKLKSEFTYKDGEIAYTKEEEKYNELRKSAYEHLRKGNFRRAKNKWDKLIKMFPNYDYYYIKRAEAFLIKSKFDDAIKDYNRALELEPQNFMVLSDRALATISKFDFQGKKKMRIRNEVTAKSINNKLEIPQPELSQICSDLTRAINHLAKDQNQRVLDAMKTYCQ